MMMKLFEGVIGSTTGIPVPQERMASPLQSVVPEKPITAPKRHPIIDPVSWQKHKLMKKLRKHNSEEARTQEKYQKKYDSMRADVLKWFDGILAGMKKSKLFEKIGQEEISKELEDDVKKSIVKKEIEKLFDSSSLEFNESDSTRLLLWQAIVDSVFTLSGLSGNGGNGIYPVRSISARVQNRTRKIELDLEKISKKEGELWAKQGVSVSYEEIEPTLDKLDKFRNSRELEKLGLQRVLSFIREELLERGENTINTIQQREEKNSIQKREKNTIIIPGLPSSLSNSPFEIDNFRNVQPEPCQSGSHELPTFSDLCEGHNCHNQAAQLFHFYATGQVEKRCSLTVNAYVNDFNQGKTFMLKPVEEEAKPVITNDSFFTNDVEDTIHDSFFTKIFSLFKTNNEEISQHPFTGPNQSMKTTSETREISEVTSDDQSQDSINSTVSTDVSQDNHHAHNHSHNHPHNDPHNDPHNHPHKLQDSNAPIKLRSGIEPLIMRNTGGLFRDLDESFSKDILGGMRDVNFGAVLTVQGKNADHHSLFLEKVGVGKNAECKIAQSWNNYFTLDDWMGKRSHNGEFMTRVHKELEKVYNGQGKSGHTGSHNEDMYNGQGKSPKSPFGFRTTRQFKRVSEFLEFYEQFRQVIPCSKLEGNLTAIFQSLCEGDEKEFQDDQKVQWVIAKKIAKKDGNQDGNKDGLIKDGLKDGNKDGSFGGDDSRRFFMPTLF